MKEIKKKLKILRKISKESLMIVLNKNQLLKIFKNNMILKISFQKTFIQLTMNSLQRILLIMRKMKDNNQHKFK